MKLWESYCSQVVFREVFSCAFYTKIPGFTARNCVFLQFLCIAERVTVHGTAFFSRAVNSNEKEAG